MPDFRIGWVVSSVVKVVVTSADLVSAVSVMVVHSMMSVVLRKLVAAVSGLRRRIGGVCGCNSVGVGWGGDDGGESGGGGH